MDLFCVNTGVLGTMLIKVPSPKPEGQFIMKWHKSPRLMESLAKDGDSVSHDSMLQKLALRAKEPLAHEDICYCVQEFCPQPKKQKNRTTGAQRLVKKAKNNCFGNIVGKHGRQFNKC